MPEPDPTPCCPPAAQEACCEATDKAACCDAGAAGQACDCAAGAGSGDVREAVRERYASFAQAITERQTAAASHEPDSCCSPAVATRDASGEDVFGAALYGEEEADEAPADAVAASLGCGVPTAVAQLRAGETVLDLGSGAGADVLISAQRVGPSGKAIGLDMTDAMLELARRNAAQAGVHNVEFVRATSRPSRSPTRVSTSSSPTAC